MPANKPHTLVPRSRGRNLETPYKQTNLIEAKERCGAKLKGGRTECTKGTKGTTVKKGIDLSHARGRNLETSYNQTNLIQSNKPHTLVPRSRGRDSAQNAQNAQPLKKETCPARTRTECFNSSKNRT